MIVMAKIEHDVIRLPGGRRVPAGACSMRADTAGGAGGQHANRSSTRIELRIDIAACGLSDSEQSLVLARLAGRINRAGELVVWAGDRRSQLQNRRLACERAEQLIADALHVAAPRTATRPSRAAKRRAREAKQHRSMKKQQRRRPEA